MNYYLSIRSADNDPIVGPHTQKAIRLWLALGVIGSDWPCSRGEGFPWIRVEEIPGIARTTVELERRVADFRIGEGAWWTQPATEAQLRRLRYFEIPFQEDGLTKGRASLLIEVFSQVDPMRLQRYEAQPASTEQTAEILGLGGEPSNLSYGAAKHLIYELKATQRDERRRAERELTDWLASPEYLLIGILKDPDVLDICKLPEFSDEQVKAIVPLIQQNVPNWRGLDK